MILDEAESAELFAALRARMTDADLKQVLGGFGKGGDHGEWFDRSCKDVPHRSICEPL